MWQNVIHGKFCNLGEFSANFHPFFFPVNKNGTSLIDLPLHFIQSNFDYHGFVFHHLQPQQIPNSGYSAFLQSSRIEFVFMSDFSYKFKREIEDWAKQVSAQLDTIGGFLASQAWQGLVETDLRKIEPASYDLFRWTRHRCQLFPID